MQYLHLTKIWGLRTAVFAISAVALFALQYGSAQAACQMWEVDCLAGEAAAKTLASILLVLVQVFNFVLGWAGMFFNWAVQVTIFEFSRYFGNSEGLLLAWTILRDLANIALLFGFVYIGIRTILDAANYDVKRTLPTFIIFAVLLNFSLFAGEAFIDVSNAVGSSIYSQATSVDCRSASNVETCRNQGIAGSVFQISGISSIGNAGEQFQNVWSSEGGVGAIGLSFALLIFVITMIIVLIAAALMLVARAITLMVLLVVSPLGFAGFAIPELQEQSKKWWKALMNNALFAPAFILLVLVGLKIAEGLKASFVPAGASITNVLVQPGANVGGIFMIFAIVIGFMIAALVSARNFSIYGADMVVDRAVRTIGGTVGGMALGTPAWLLRNSAGRLGRKTAEFARTSPFFRTRPGLARMVAGAGETVGKQSFDVRPVAKIKLPGMGDNSLGIPNATQRKGYSGIRDAAEKERKDFAEKLKLTDKEEKAIKEAEGEKKKADETIRTTEKENAREASAMTERHKEEVGEKRTALNTMLTTQAAAVGALEKERTESLKAAADSLAKIENDLKNAKTDEEKKRLEAEKTEKEDQQKKVTEEFEKRREEMERKHQEDERVARKGLKDQQETHRQEREKMETRHEQTITPLKKSTEEIAKSIKDMKNAPKQQYADALDKEITVPVLSVQKIANKKAAEAIREKIKKGESEEDKMVKAFTKKVKEMQSKEEKDSDGDKKK